MSSNATGISEQKKTTSRTPNDQATDKIKSKWGLGPDNRVGGEEFTATLAPSFFRNPACVDWQVVLVKQNLYLGHVSFKKCCASKFTVGIMILHCIIS